MVKHSSSASADAQLIIAPLSPPCSPHFDGLAGFHRAPNHRYPQPKCTTPSAIVQRSKFRPAHPRQPPNKSVAQHAPPSCGDDWMMLKLDEDLSDHEHGYTSDGFDSDEDIALRYRRRAEPYATARSGEGASAGGGSASGRGNGGRGGRAPVAKSAPVRIPERRKADTSSTRRRRVVAYLPHSSAYYPRANASSSSSRKRRPSYNSSDSESEDR